MAQEFVTALKFFDIADYSIVESFSTRISIPSEHFTVGGYDWVIKFFPQGNDDSVSEYISVFLKLLNAKKDVQAMYSFRLRDWINSKRLNTLRVMQMMNQYRPVEELLDNQNGTDEAGPTENGVEDVEMPLASSGELVAKPKPESEPEPKPDSGNIAQEDDASADDSKMEE